eukprot:4247472-Pyramimonas_sp.AAC.1
MRGTLPSSRFARRSLRSELLPSPTWDGAGTSTNDAKERANQRRMAMTDVDISRHRPTKPH